jgi:Transglutaminase-like domain
VGGFDSSGSGGGGAAAAVVEKGAFDETVQQLTTPQMISDFMQVNIPYATADQREASRSQGFDWKTPEETFDDGYGFCYDLSAFALYCLLADGYDDARIMFVCWGNWGHESSSGHFVAFFQNDGYYYTINNGDLHGRFHSIDDVMKDASWGRPIIHYHIFAYDEIPFGIKYEDMDYFCDPEF